MGGSWRTMDKPKRGDKVVWFSPINEGDLHCGVVAYYRHMGIEGVLVDFNTKSILFNGYSQWVSYKNLLFLKPKHTKGIPPWM